jgi:hypothetical protein
MLRGTSRGTSPAALAGVFKVSSLVQGGRLRRPQARCAYGRTGSARRACGWRRSRRTPAGQRRARRRERALTKENALAARQVSEIARTEQRCGSSGDNLPSRRPPQGLSHRVKGPHPEVDSTCRVGGPLTRHDRAEPGRRDGRKPPPCGCPHRDIVGGTRYDRRPQTAAANESDMSVSSQVAGHTDVHGAPLYRD